jgi:cysteine-rich repeat protein
MCSWRAAGLALVVAGCLDWGALQQGACGDGFVGPEESCDDGNVRGGDGCSASCLVEEPYCGDGRVNADEVCDDANTDDSDSCHTNCELARCGDGKLWQFVEQCDDGAQDAGDGCSPSCTLEPAPEPCGDGVPEAPEECDDGNRDGGDGCSANCTLEPPPELCGNGVLDEGEACDDGNTSSADRCLKGCSHATCGDGFTRTGVEECDDGNLRNDDACSACLSCNVAGTSHFRTANSHCYELFTTPLPREDARRTCLEKGGDLWTVNNEMEEDGVIQNLMITDGSLWIGLRNTDGVLSWVTGDPPSYTNFAPGQPGTAVPCVATQVTGGAPLWQSGGCLTSKPFICERNPAMVYAATTHHAYRVVTVEATFADAEAACAAGGAYLANVDSYDEQVFLAERITPDVWLRSNDMTCLLLTGEELSEDACEASHAYVCEVD